jgi:hypothetical protein
MADDNSAFEQYWRHSKDLRNWFVGYGVGAILFMTSKDVISILNSKSIDIPTTAMWFLFGAGCQVALAFINRLYNYRLYMKEIYAPIHATAEAAIPGVLSAQFIMQLPVDASNPQTLPFSGQLSLQLPQQQKAQRGRTQKRGIDSFWWIDTPVDVITFVLYAIGTYHLFRVF